MAVIPYAAASTLPSPSVSMIKAFQIGTSPRNMLAALGDYWRDYFPDHAIVEALQAGALTLFSTEYNKVVHQVLCSSLLDIPISRPVKYDLLMFRSDNARITEDYIAYDLSGWTDVAYLSTSLFEALCTLEKGVHYSMVGSEIRFYVDIFNDPTIINNTYTATFNGVKCTLLWAMNVVLSESYIFERFGTYLYKEQENSETYKNLLIALQYFYTTTKSIQRIEATVNILFGLPFSRYPGEVVTAIDMVNEHFALTSAPTEIPAPADTPAPAMTAEYYHRVTTDKGVYYASYFSELLVSVGDVLNDYELICRFHRVDDYITNPEWMDGSRVPYELIVSYDDPDYMEEFTPGGEFEDYIPYLTEKYNHLVQYNASRLFVGDTGLSVSGGGAQGNSGGGSPANMGAVAGGRRHPLQRIRLWKTATGWKGRLYNLVDTVLKYNIVYFRTQLNFDNYDFYMNQVGNLTEIIQSGFPVYLYPLVDVVFSASFADTINTKDGDITAAATYDAQDKYNPGNTLPTPYDKSVQYNGTILFGGVDNPLFARLNTRITDTYTGPSELLSPTASQIQISDGVRLCTESASFVVLNKAGSIVYSGSF